MHEISLLQAETQKLTPVDLYKVYVYARTLAKIREEQNGKEKNAHE